MHARARDAYAGRRSPPHPRARFPHGYSPGARVRVPRCSTGRVMVHRDGKDTGGRVHETYVRRLNRSQQRLAVGPPTPSTAGPFGRGAGSGCAPHSKALPVWNRCGREHVRSWRAPPTFALREFSPERGHTAVRQPVPCIPRYKSRTTIPVLLIRCSSCPTTGATPCFEPQHPRRARRGRIRPHTMWGREQSNRWRGRGCRQARGTTGRS